MIGAGARLVYGAGRWIVGADAGAETAGAGARVIFDAGVRVAGTNAEVKTDAEVRLVTWGGGQTGGRRVIPLSFPFDLHRPPSPCSFNCCGNLFLKFALSCMGGQRLSLVQVKSHGRYSN